ncbi:MAG: hypothetical protein SVY10_21065 [Thermodesulfobacteriota bacterium]|nr:hypothetical protein [Thermodesulfobacteriota bacterium]
MKRIDCQRITTIVLTCLIIICSFGYSATGSVKFEGNKKEIVNKAYSAQIPFIENKGQL